MRFREEKHLRFWQSKARVAIRQVGGDDAAEGEAEVAGLVQLRLDAVSRIRLKPRDAAVDAIESGRDTGLDVVRAGARRPGRGLPAGIDDDVAF